MTEVASNTATANVVLPILLGLAEDLSLPPAYLALPAALACSYAFMLPAATPPNAMAFEAAAETAGMTAIEMAAVGAVMNIVCVVTALVAVSGIRSSSSTSICPVTPSNEREFRILKEMALQG